MAKMKTFAVDVEIVLRRTLYVEARRPNGAAQRLRTDEGWSEAVRDADDPVLDEVRYETQPSDLKITRIREC